MQKPWIGILASLLVFATQGHAEEAVSEEAVEPPLIPRSFWEIAPESYWFFYEEPDIFIKMEGWMYGLRASMTQRSEANRLMGRFEGRYASGRVDYEGSLSDGTPHDDKGTDHIFELRGFFGYDWPSEQGLITLLTGLGYRFWYNHLESVNAYERNVSYLYSPIGLEGTYAFNEKWRIGASVEYDLFWQGWVKSNLSDVSSAFGDVENTQDSGFGVRGSLSIQHVFNQSVTFSVEPFIRYWDIENSDTSAVTFLGFIIGSGYEPANKTLEAGLTLSFLF